MTLQQKINSILYPNKADMLVFGCEIKSKITEEYIPIEIDEDFMIGNECYFDDSRHLIVIDAYDFRLDEFQIIGKPIMLDDLLLAIYKIDIFIELINNGDYVSIRTGANSFVTWHLGKQLTEQSEETKDKLNTIFNDKTIT